MTRTRSLLLVPVVAVALLVAGRELVVLDPQGEPLVVEADGPVLSGLEDMAAASDLVVVGTVIGAGPGRVLTDPGDPTVGIRTELLAVEVERSLVGARPARLVVEQESSLLDGTPIAVEGRSPTEVGERGAFFLVAGTGPDEPYHAFVGPEGWMAMVGDRLVPEPSTGPVTLDELADALGR